MTCDEVKSKLKPFLEDMLAEDEYRLFVAHIDSCSKCRDYVRSFGSLSNQLWKLGEVEVPHDFVSTVIFNLKHLKSKAPSKVWSVTMKKLSVGIIILLLLAAASFLWILYSRRQPLSQKISDAPIITTQIIRGQRPLGSLEAVTLLGETKETEEKAALPQEKESVAQTQTVTEPPTLEQAVFVATRPLHWHFLYAEEAEKRKLLDSFIDLGIALERRTEDLILFNATAEELDNLITQVIAGSGQDTPLRNFTVGIPTFKDRKSRVSVYFENVKNQDSGVLHWHIGLLLPRQKDKLFDAIRSLNGSIDYDVGEIAVFSVPKTEVEALKKRIRIMGVMFTEFGKLESAERRLSSIPVKISVYFQGGEQ